MVIIITGAATLGVPILGQLRVTDLARVREIGRINSAALVARAQLFFQSNTIRLTRLQRSKRSLTKSSNSNTNTTKPLYYRPRQPANA
jgi:hypothetical protein